MPSTVDALKLELEIARLAASYTKAAAADKPKLLQQMEMLTAQRAATRTR